MKNIAPAWLRLIAGLIEFSLGVLILLYFTLTIVSGRSVDEILDAGLKALLYAFIVLPVLIPLVNLILVTKFGGSVGKLLTSIAVTDSKGKSVSFKTAFFREVIGKMVSNSFVSLGNIWIFVDRERRGWHDMLADTYVIKKTEYGLVTGIAALLILLAGNWLIGTQIISGVNRNIPLYMEIFTDLKQEMFKNPAEESNQVSPKAKYQSPTPLPTGRI